METILGQEVLVPATPIAPKNTTEGQWTEAPARRGGKKSAAGQPQTGTRPTNSFEILDDEEENMEAETSQTEELKEKKDRTVGETDTKEETPAGKEGKSATKTKNVKLAEKHRLQALYKSLRTTIDKKSLSFYGKQTQ